MTIPAQDFTALGRALHTLTQPFKYAAEWVTSNYAQVSLLTWCDRHHIPLMQLLDVAAEVHPDGADFQITATSKVTVAFQDPVMPTVIIGEHSQRYRALTITPRGGELYQTSDGTVMVRIQATNGVSLWLAKSLGPVVDELTGVQMAVEASNLMANKNMIDLSPRVTLPLFAGVCELDVSWLTGMHFTDQETMRRITGVTQHVSLALAPELLELAADVSPTLFPPPEEVVFDKPFLAFTTQPDSSLPQTVMYFGQSGEGLVPVAPDV